MSPKLWSDEDRLFIPRMGGWTINFKYIARKLGWVTSAAVVESPAPAEPSDEPKSSEDRLADAVERSRFEDS